MLTAFRINLHSGTRAERSGGLMWCPSVRHLIICLLLSSRVALLDNGATLVFWFILLCCARPVGLLTGTRCLSSSGALGCKMCCFHGYSGVSALMHALIYCSESCEWGHASVKGGSLTVCYITVYTVHYIELLILYAHYYICIFIRRSFAMLPL